MTTNSSALILPAPSTSAATTASAANSELHDIKAPVEIPNWWAWAGLALALIALALAYWRWRRRARRVEEGTPVPVIPPHERARQKLREALALLGEPRPFCIAVADTIRVYLEERFELHAPERTTEEFLEELQNSSLLTFDQKQTLGDFLTRCDLVKFARYEPGRPELQALYDAATRLVDETEPAPTPADGAATAPDAKPVASA